MSEKSTIDMIQTELEELYFLAAKCDTESSYDVLKTLQAVQKHILKVAELFASFRGGIKGVEE